MDQLCGNCGHYQPHSRRDPTWCACGQPATSPAGVVIPDELRCDPTPITLEEALDRLDQLGGLPIPERPRWSAP